MPEIKKHFIHIDEEEFNWMVYGDIGTRYICLLLGESFNAYAGDSNSWHISLEITQAHISYDWIFGLLLLYYGRILLYIDILDMKKCSHWN